MKRRYLQTYAVLVVLIILPTIILFQNCGKGFEVREFASLNSISGITPNPKDLIGPPPPSKQIEFRTIPQNLSGLTSLGLMPFTFV